MKKTLIGIIFGIITALGISLAADNYTISQGSGKTLGSDTVSSVDYPLTKIALGAADAVDEHLSFKEITWISASYAESSITASYTTALSTANAKRGCIIQNLTDTDQTISFDASVGYRLPAGFEREFTWGDQFFKETGHVSVKYVTNPSAGTLEVLCWY